VYSCPGALGAHQREDLRCVRTGLAQHREIGVPVGRHIEVLDRPYRVPVGQHDTAFGHAPRHPSVGVQVLHPVAVQRRAERPVGRATDEQRVKRGVRIVPVAGLGELVGGDETAEAVVRVDQHDRPAADG
jgi:hypothetical protein